MKLPAATQVEHTRQRQDASHRAFMSSQAKRKLSARGMSGDAHPVEVEFSTTVIRSIAQSVKGAANIFKAAWPSAARISHAAVFNIPSGHACGFERMAKMARIGQVILGSPIAAVNKE